MQDWCDRRRMLVFLIVVNVGLASLFYNILNQWQQTSQSRDSSNDVIVVDRVEPAVDPISRVDISRWSVEGALPLLCLCDDIWSMFLKSPARMSCGIVGMFA